MVHIYNVLLLTEIKHDEIGWYLILLHLSVVTWLPIRHCVHSGVPKIQNEHKFII